MQHPPPWRAASRSPRHEAQDLAALARRCPHGRAGAPGASGYADVDGNVTPGDAPGFGAALDRRKLERYAF
jgi:hypothetical protein